MAKRYVIKWGDDWTVISEKFRISPTALARMNKDILAPIPGTVIKVPDQEERPPQGYPVTGQPVRPAIPPDLPADATEAALITEDMSNREIWDLARQGLLVPGESRRRTFGGNRRASFENWIARRGGPSLREHERNWAYQRWGRRGETVQDFWNRLYSQMYVPSQPKEQPAQTQTQQAFVPTPVQTAAATAAPPVTLPAGYQPPVNPMQPVIERDRGMVGPSPRMQLKTAPPRSRSVPGVEQLPQFLPSPTMLPDTWLRVNPLPQSLPRQALPRPTMLPDTWLQGIPRTVAATRAQLMAGVMPRTISLLDQILLRIYDSDMDKMGYRWNGRTWELREPARREIREIRGGTPLRRGFEWDYGRGRGEKPRRISAETPPEPVEEPPPMAAYGGFIPPYVSRRGVSPTGRILNNAMMGLIVWRGI